MNALCSKKTPSPCLQAYLSADELRRVELYRFENLRKSRSSAVRALIERFFKKNIDIKQISTTKIRGIGEVVFDEKREKVVQCYLPPKIGEKLNQFRSENSFGSDSECARVIIIKALDNEGIE